MFLSVDELPEFLIFMAIAFWPITILVVVLFFVGIGFFLGRKND